MSIFFTANQSYFHGMHDAMGKGGLIHFIYDKFVYLAIKH